MRKTKAFRPTISDALEQRLVLQGSGAVNPMTLYKAEVGSYVSSAFNNLYGGSFGNINLNASTLTPAQLSLLQAGAQNQISLTTSALDAVLAPLKKSKNLIGIVNTEMSNLSTEVNGLYTQLASGAFTTSGGVTTFNTDAGSLASSTISNMQSSVTNAVGNQVQLFVFAKGISTKPGKAFLSSMFSTYNSQLTAPFAAVTSGMTTAFNTYLSNSNASTFETTAYGLLGTLTTSVNGVFTANHALAPVTSAMTNQMSSAGYSSVYGAILNLESTLEGATTTTYPAGFVNVAINNLDAVLQTDLAASGSA